MDGWLHSSQFQTDLSQQYSRWHFLQVSSVIDFIFNSQLIWSHWASQRTTKWSFERGQLIEDNWWLFLIVMFDCVNLLLLLLWLCTFFSGMRWEWRRRIKLGGTKTAKWKMTWQDNVYECTSQCEVNSVSHPFCLFVRSFVLGLFLCDFKTFYYFESFLLF